MNDPQSKQFWNSACRKAEAEVKSCWQDIYDRDEHIKKIEADLAGCRELLEESCSDEARVNDYTKEVEAERDRLQQLVERQKKINYESGVELTRLKQELAEANEWIKDFELENRKLVNERDQLKQEWLDVHAEAQLYFKENKRLRKVVDRAKKDWNRRNVLDGITTVAETLIRAGLVVDSTILAGWCQLARNALAEENDEKEIRHEKSED